jgi:signal transduction histidine kinase
MRATNTCSAGGRWLTPTTTVKVWSSDVWRQRRATPRNYSATARKHSAIPQIWRTAVDLILEHQQSYLDAQERAAKQEAALVDARDAANLREQFVAILAHDLRNPLASIDAGINVLLHRRPDEKTLREGELADHLLQMLLERLIWMAVQRNPPPNLTKRQLRSVGHSGNGHEAKHGCVGSRVMRGH